MQAKVTIKKGNGFITSKENLTSSSGITFISYNEKKKFYRSIANKIFRISQTLVPVKNGNLKNSGHIRINSDGTYRIEYKQPYAIFVHEVLSNRHESPTQAKYLEDAGYIALAQIYEQTGDIKPAFTFRMEMSVEDGVILYIDSISQEEFIGWVKDTRGIYNIDQLD